MSMLAWIGLGACAGFAMPWLVLRRRAANGPAPPSAARTPSTPAPPNPYHAVSVRPGLICCRAVEELAGQRFLSAEAPELPLVGCDTESCECVYIHHADRRSGQDRRDRWSTYSGFDPNKHVNQRKGGDRRRRSGKTQA